MFNSCFLPGVTFKLSLRKRALNSITVLLSRGGKIVSLVAETGTPGTREKKATYREDLNSLPVHAGSPVLG